MLVMPVAQAAVADVSLRAVNHTAFLLPLGGALKASR